MPSILEMKFIIDVLPKSASEDVALNSPITVRFGRDINPDTINGAIIVTKMSTGVRIPGTITYQAKTATFVSKDKYEPSEVYQVTVLGDHGTNSPCIKDAIGNAMPQDLVWSFKTTADVGLVAPIPATPADATLVEGPAVRFTFGIVKDATHYEIMVSNSQDFDKIVWNTMIYPAEDNVSNGILTVVAAGPFLDGDYYWKIRAMSATSGPWSLVRQFSIKAPSNSPSENVQYDITPFFCVESTSPEDKAYQITPTEIKIKLSDNVNLNSVTAERFYIIPKRIQ